MPQILLADLGKDQRFEGILMVKSAQKRLNKNGDPYLDMTLADKSADINAKVWNWDMNPPASGDILYVHSVAVDFNGRKQMRIDRFQTALPQEVDLNLLVAAAPRAPEEMMGEIDETINQMINPVLKALLTAMVQKKREKLLYYPAAQSMHHAERSGLLHHTCDMLKAAKALCACYPSLDAELLFSGVIAHDLDKIDELDADEMGIVSSYTKGGSLLGHLVSGVAEIRKTADELGFSADEEYVLLLCHMVISHHEKPEYGSPRYPMFPEAEVLCILDRLDAHLFEMQAVIERTRPGCFSDRIPALERKLYHPRYLNDVGFEEGENSESGANDFLGYEGLL